MSKLSRFSLPLVAVAGLLICLVIQLANSAAPQTKDGLVKRSQRDGTHRSASEATGKVKRAAPATSADKPQGSKFQARMGNDQSQIQQQQQQSGGQQEAYYSSFDSWNPHSLIPTFTDAEQGDEMVALASDSEPEQFRPNSSRSVVVAPPPPQQQQQQSPQNDAQSPKYDHRYPQERPMPPPLFEKPTNEGQSVGPQQHPVRASKQRHQTVDEYYSEEDGEDDEEPMKGVRGDFEGGFGNQDRKERGKFRSTPQQQQQQPPAEDVLGQQQQQFNEESSYRPIPNQPEQQQQQGYRNGPMEPAVEKQQPAPKQQPMAMPSHDARWLPSSDTTQIGSSLNLNRPSITNQQQFASEQQRTRESGSQQSMGGERMAKPFFGSRDQLSPFSKTDAAIEYLRSLLKTKQKTKVDSNSTNDWASIESPKQQPQVQVQVDMENSNAGTSNLQRLSSFASKLSQMLNSTSAQPTPVSQNLTSDRKSKSIEFPSSFQIEETQMHHLHNGNNRFIPTGSQQTTDAKFSAVDAKTLPLKPSDGFYPAAQFVVSTSTTTTTTTTTSKPSLLNDDRRNAQQQQQFYSNPDPAGLMDSAMIQQEEPSKPEPYSQQESLSQLNAQNGTPLGGEYIESLDEFPRSQRQQQQLQRQNFPQESRLIPVIQQDGKPEVQQQQTGSAVVGGLDITAAAGQVKDQQATKSQPLNQINPLHFDRESFENFQRQISGVPSSSKYFQMQRASAERPDRQQPEPKPVVGSHLAEVATSVQQAPAKEEVAQVQAQESPRPSANQQQPNNYYAKSQANNFAEQTIAAQAKKSKVDEQKRQQQVIAHQERTKQAQPTPQEPQPSRQHQQVSQISSKIYMNNEAPHNFPPHHHLLEPHHPQPPPHLNHHPKQPQQHIPNHQLHQAHQQYSKQPLPQPQPPMAGAPLDASQFPGSPMDSKTVHKPPKIVSYNYFESPSEAGESELQTTNYQLGDTLYSSTGGAEQILSNSELEAIQNQFLTVEHPLVPIDGSNADHLAQQQQQQAKHHLQAHPGHLQDQSLTGLLANLKPNLQPDMLQKLSSPARQAEEAMRELASNEDHVSVPAPPMFNVHQAKSQAHPQPADNGGVNEETNGKRSPTSAGRLPADAKKKKSLIVYLNHPRPNDMSKVSSSSEESYSLSQTIGDPQSEPFIAAKEFDIHGLSKETKHLDISSARDSGVDLKEAKDKDGLSVVVIGDAYKYKKIVLLISSKSGGLKFIPMVKDMKK